MAENVPLHSHQSSMDLHTVEHVFITFPPTVYLIHERQCILLTLKPTGGDRSTSIPLPLFEYPSM